MASGVLFLALLSIGMSVGAQFLLKMGMSSPAVAAAGQGAALDLARAVFCQPAVLGGLGLYAAGAVIWLAVLARWDVSKAYPLVGLGFAVTVMLGWWLGEQVNPSRALGVAVICCGVWLVARS
jgi:multidrug transporter EmrE-like cation transporter